MSILGFIVVGWLLLNAALFTALMVRRSHPAMRERLFRWVVDGERRRGPLRRAKAARRKA